VSQALERNDQDVAARLALARLKLDAGVLSAYRRACAALPTDAGPPLSRSIAWACALAPDALPDLGPLLQAAAKAAAAQDHPSLRTHGALLLRAGRHADALKRLGEALKSRGPHATPCEELLLAIAYHHLGQPAEARRWLSQATAWLDAPRAAGRAGAALAAPPGPALPALPGLVLERPDERELLFGLQAWLDVQVLRREAEALIAPPKR
jgi:hypothetical protein